MEKIIPSDIGRINTSNAKWYSSQLKRRLNVKFNTIAYLADSPEHHTLCSLTIGNGNYTLQWGYLYDKRHIANFLPACEKCLRNLIKGKLAAKIRCRKCLKWGISDTSHILANFSPPEFYPSEIKDAKMGR